MSMTARIAEPRATAFLGVEASILGRRWTPRAPEAEGRGAEIAASHRLPDLIGLLLAMRAVPLADAPAYLEPTLRDLTPDPLSLADMAAAADRLATAARGKQRVAVFGDYDVDGACSAALIIEWLRAAAPDAPPPTLYVPDRIDEGYGLSVAAMAQLGAGHDLIVAVDCGTLSFEPVAAARAAGAEVIVVDHHLAQETVPDCAAVVNPNRQDDASGQGSLCAAGVAFLLLIAATRRLGAKIDLLSLLDLVALATVADIAPLTGVNRAFVRQGLKVMARRERLGLRALADAARLSTAPTAYHLGFLLGPRINAGGRIGQADLGARLLLTRDPAEAARMAGELDALNDERRRIEAEVLEAAIAAVEARPGGPEAALVWAAEPGWHPGVVGIVASRLKERYNRPALVIGFDAEGVGKGSGRSVEGVDLGGSIATLAREGLIAKGGGHRMAAGVTLSTEQLGAAVARLDGLLARQGAASAGPRDLRIDAVLTPAAATLELIQDVERVGPFGAGSPAPRFAIPAARLLWVKTAGEAHIRFTAADQTGARLDAIAFRALEGPLGDFLTSRNGAPTHLAGRIEIDDFGGRRRPKLRLEDAAPV